MYHLSGGLDTLNLTALLSTCCPSHVEDGRGNSAPTVGRASESEETDRRSALPTNYMRRTVKVGQVREDPMTKDARPTGRQTGYCIRRPNKIGSGFAVNPR